MSLDDHRNVDRPPIPRAASTSDPKLFDMIACNREVAYIFSATLSRIRQSFPMIPLFFPNGFRGGGTAPVGGGRAVVFVGFDKNLSDVSQDKVKIL
jgi:hypothetical protein